MNGTLVSSNPRLMIKNNYSSELVIKSIELSDEGQYECQTDQIVNYIVHLVVFNCKLYNVILFFFKGFYFYIISINY